MRLAAAALIVTLAPLATAETRSTPEAEGRRILDRAVEAMGGAKFLAMKDRTATGWTGSWYNQTSKLVRTTFYASYTPDGLAERLAFDKDGAYSHLYNNEGGYEITFRGVRPVAGEKLERRRMESRNDILFILRSRLNEPGISALHSGSRVCENQSADIVDIMSANENDPVVQVCFSRVTGLPIRQSYFRRDPATRDRIEEVTLFARYQDAGGGVQWPRAVSHWRDGAQVSETFLETVEINRGLEAALFAIPKDKAVKMLPAISRLL